MDQVAIECLRANLQERTQLVQILYARLGMHQSSLVREAAVAADKDIASNCLPEHFNSKHVSHNLFRFPVQSVRSLSYQPDQCCIPSSFHSKCEPSIENTTSLAVRGA
jgi:hypothetical protein